MILYAYVMTNDSGFAPCVQNGLLSLACCKGGINGGMRGKIGQEFNNIKQAGSDDQIWVMGVCGKRLADTPEQEYSPVFLARATDAPTMKEYFSPDSNHKERTDYQAYTIEGGELRSTENNPHKDSAADIKKDIGGGYVILSDCFVYWGNDCGNKKGEIIKNAFAGIFADTEQKKSITHHCRGYMVDRNLICDMNSILTQLGLTANSRYITYSDHGINQEYIPDENENCDDEEIIIACKCGR